MKKMFVISMLICVFVLTGCKPALPGATIYISNETGTEPESYELDILFDDSRTTNPRAFHMKNIGREIASSSRSIVLENMPPTLYKAEVNAYDKDGLIIGYGSQRFQASDTASVYVTVSEIPYAFCSKDKTKESREFDSITLEVIPDDNLRETISGFNFRIGSSTPRFLNLTGDNLYRLELAEGTTDEQSITITPVMNDRTTELTSFKQSVTAQPNIKLEEITFEGIDADKVQKMELGLSPLEFNIKTTPDNYTKFEEGSWTFSEKDAASVSIKDNHVKIKAKKPGTNTFTYSIPVPGQSPVEKSVDINVGLHEPELAIEARGSSIVLSWGYVHPDSSVTLMKKQRTVGKQEEMTSITIEKGANEYTDSIGKKTKVEYWLEITHTGADSVRSNHVTHQTGENSLVDIVIPDIENMKVEFEHDLIIDEPLPMGRNVELKAIRSTETRNISWLINGKVVSNDDVFIYSPNDPGHGLKPNSDMNRVEILLVVETKNGELYSKNIRLTYKMESNI